MPTDDLREAIAKALHAREGSRIPWENVTTFPTLRQCAEWYYAEADAVLAAITARAWIVEKIPHDANPSVRPVLMRGGWIRREAGDSEPWHTRQYAAQLLAAADAVEEAGRG